MYVRKPIKFAIEILLRFQLQNRQQVFTSFLEGKDQICDV